MWHIIATPGRSSSRRCNYLVALTRFLDDGWLPIDKGIVERLHRRPPGTSTRVDGKPPTLRTVKTQSGEIWVLCDQCPDDPWDD